METGRNDPCPCGSGKKYKKCCLIKQDISFDESSVLIDAEKRLDRKIFEFYEDHKNSIMVSEVGKLLFGDDFNETILYRDQTKDILFNQYAIFNYRPAFSGSASISSASGGSTLFEKFHVEQYQVLDETEKQIINDWGNAHWGLFEIQEVFPGKGSFIKDVFTGEEYNLRDIASSQIFQKWDILFSKIQPLGNVWRFCVVGFSLGQMRKSQLQEFILDAFEEYQKNKRVSTLAEFINTFPHLAINNAFTVKQQLPKMVSPEGDELEISKAVYRVKDFMKAADVLADNADFVIDNIDKDDSGNPVKYFISWHQAGKSQKVVPIVPGYRHSAFFDIQRNF